MAQRVKDLATSLQVASIPAVVGFNPWLRNFHMLWQTHTHTHTRLYAPPGNCMGHLFYGYNIKVYLI